MAIDAFADWIARGRAHQQEDRPADAIPCFRRAAREDPRSPVPHFHLGEVYWQLGLAGDAVNAWRVSAQLDRTLLAPRLALAEAAMNEGDFATARDMARETVQLSPADRRARATLVTASAASGDRVALGETAAAFAADPSLAHAPNLAAATAAALAIIRDGDERKALLDKLTPHGATLPASLLAALAENGVAISDALAARRWTIADAEFLRRLAVVAQSRDQAVADN
ncbi:MAG: hypothetical protein ABI624_22015, partial [Casimicrobiaceae bacterium]